MGKFCQKNINCFNSSSSCEMCPKKEGDVIYSIQVGETGELEIPMEKPDLESVLDEIKEFKITEESEILVSQTSGKKVVIGGLFSLGIEYLSKTATQIVNFANWNLNFKALIMDVDNTLLPIDFNLDDYVVHVCVEYLKVIKVNERKVRYSYVLLIWLQDKVN